MSPDAVASSGGAAEADPLATPAGAVDTSFPLIQPGQRHRLIIQKPRLEDSKTKEGVKFLVFKLATTEPTKSTEGVTLHPGFGFLHRITIASPDRDVNDVKRDLALLLQAVEGPKTTTTLRALLDNVNMLDGKPVDAKVDISKSKDPQYSDSNSAKFEIPKA